MKKLILLLTLLLSFVLLSSCVTENRDNGNEGGQEPHVCEFTVESTKPTYIKERATCTERAVYYLSCSCGKMGDETFSYGELAGHRYAKITSSEFLVKEATSKTAAIYLRSCSACGAVGTDTFVYGDPIKLTEEQKQYLPTSVTVTLYDVEGGVYGFTYNTLFCPEDPVIQIREEGKTEWREYVPRSYETATLDASDTTVQYFISKAEIALTPGTVYVYRISDRAKNVSTPEVILKTQDEGRDSFTFTHISDSQAGHTEFGMVMEAINGRSDFALHTGDVVQHAQYEYEWREMLDGNYETVMSMPMMAISGNHETTYANTTYQTFNHFNNNIPDQSSSANGYYYSFVYNDVKFIMLNTNDLVGNKIKDEQYNWLISELQSNTCRWTVVAMHNPMYSVGKYGSNEEKNAIALALREQLGDVFYEYGVDLVLQGHDHTISRTYPIGKDGAANSETTVEENGVSYIADPDGVIYAMNGPAGTQQRVPEESYEDVYAYAETSKKASWADITVTNDTLTVTVKWIDGSGEHVYYTWGIKKS